MEKITVLFYTNETYCPIANLSIDEFNRFSKDLEIKKILVSNKFNENDGLSYLDFEKVDASVELRSDTRHFAKVILKGLEKVTTKYVLFLLDDTLVINDIKIKNLESVLNFMDGEEIDHLSLMSYGHPWEVVNADYKSYGLPDDYIFNTPKSYVHMFSLQPAIWKTSSFIELLEHNTDISIKEFDVSHFKNKKGEIRGGADGEGHIYTPDNFWDYGFKHCCFKRYFENTPFPFDDRPEEGDYFLFLWNESIVGGKFNINRHNNCRHHILKFLKEKNITKEHPIYGKYVI